MHRVLVLGAGKIGALISGLLAESGSYKVQLGDIDGTAAEAVVRAHETRNILAFALDASDAAALARHLAEQPLDAVVSSLPYYCNVGVAAAARKARLHYFDLTEDVDVTRSVRTLAAGAGQAFVPQCGLAPGFISIAAAELITHFDALRAVKLRVGALPQHPNNVLKYSLTWSTEGLINSEPGAAELRRLARGESGRVCQRVLMIANMLEGMEHEEAARLAGLSRSAAYEWHNRYEEDGIEGLRDRPRPGRQPRVDAVTSARFKERIVAGAELERDGVVAFRAVDAQRILKEEFAIDCSLSSTYRLLHRIKLSWLAPRPRHPQADATAQAAFSQLLDCN